jgi:eukaryotic-like serine/threonine-protein kinase
MADVYLAVAHGLSGFNKLVVLKVIRAEVAEDADARNMFVDEARLAGRLSHPNVVHTLEVGEETGRPILVMEHLDGQALYAAIRRCKRDEIKLPIEYGLRILAESLRGLQYAHSLKDFDGTPLHLVHRDVSPQNIFVTYDGQIKMLDFGIAKAAISSSETRAGMMKGKAAYMAPEQVSGEAMDHRADIYSAGVVLWQLLTGKQWWKGKPQGQILLTVLNGDVPKPSAFCDDVDEVLEAICTKAMSVNPAKRFQSANEMLEALEAALDTRGNVSARDVGKFVADLFEDEREMLGRTLETELRSFSESGSHRHRAQALSTSVDDSQGSIRSVNTDSSLIDSEAAQDESSGKRRMMFVFAAVALFAVAGIGWLVLRSPGQKPIAPVVASAPPEPVVSVEAPVVTSAPVVASAAPVSSCIFSIKAQPKNAKIFLDDKELKGNPVDANVLRDGKVHAVRAEAPGFVTRTVEIPADRDAKFVVDLDRIYTGRGAPPPPKAPKTAATTAAPPPPPPPTKKPPEEDPKTARDRIKDLDTSSPW